MWLLLKRIKALNICLPVLSYILFCNTGIYICSQTPENAKSCIRSQFFSLAQLMKLKSLLRTTLFYAERWHFSVCWCLMSYAPTQRHCNNQKKKKKYLMKILKISMAGLLITNEVFISRMIKLNQFFSQVNKELRIFVN